MPELFVTNFNRNFTGVSATAANVVRQQVGLHDIALVGQALPDCPLPITVANARRLSGATVDGYPFAIWHVRRNPEMRAAIWARDVLRLPIRIVFTSAAQRRHSWYPRQLIDRMDAVVATTDAAASYVPHVRGVVPHGVDTVRFSPPEDRAAAWAALGYGGTLGIASVGRIRPEKGTDLFVEAMLRLLPDMPGAVALVIGKASGKHQAFQAGLQAQVRAAGLQGRILFPGEIAAAESPAVIQGLSLIMQLPRYEGYGMVPLEGMASGVPFVGSDAGYYKAFSAQGRCGMIVETAAQAADAARQMLSDPVRHAVLRKAARDVVVAHFSAENEAQGIEAVYQELWSAAR